MKVLVCGGRNLNNRTGIWTTLDAQHAKSPITILIHGACSGVDTIAGIWAKSREVVCYAYPAKWTKYGRAAGPIRNQQMIDEAKPDLVIAFPGGDGTEDMKEKARSAAIEVMEAKL